MVSCEYRTVLFSGLKKPRELVVDPTTRYERGRDGRGRSRGEGRGRGSEKWREVEERGKGSVRESGG